MFKIDQVENFPKVQHSSGQTNIQDSYLVKKKLEK